MKQRTRILQTGRNCWRKAHSDRVSFIVDGANYFRALYEALPAAREQILVLSWDIYSRLRLVLPQEADAKACPAEVGELIEETLKKNSALRAYILNWDFSLIFQPDREWLPIYKLDWKSHKRLTFCLDDQCPVGASHHQKVVVIDDALAFAGGLDITRGRWDTSDHDPYNTARENIDDAKVPIQPYHDIQMAVSGKAAAALGALARERWQRAMGKPLPAVSGRQPAWPGSLSPDIENVDVAIVRTEPAYNDFTAVSEVRQLYLDSIAAARDYIYIENQYFTSPVIAEALAQRLREVDGPEVILNLPLRVNGWLSQKSMDVMRVGLLKELQASDKHSRLQVYYPHNDTTNVLPINMHAKLTIIDNRFLRIGSSNLNNRSMGLDTECDLCIETLPNERADVIAAIRRFRNRLLGEHLDCTAEEIGAAIESRGSVIRGIKALRKGDRTLRDLVPELPDPDERFSRDVKIADPEQPLGPAELLNHFVPGEQAHSARRRLFAWTVAIIFVLALSLAWNFTSLGQAVQVDRLVDLAERWQQDPGLLLPVIVVAVFAVAGILAIPVTALIAASVFAFGPVAGFLLALAGSMLSAIGGYGIGHVLGRNTIRQLAGKRLNRVSRFLARRGLLTILVLRIVPVAPFAVINLVAGGSRIRFRDFSLGSLFGIIPGILGITLVADRVLATLRSPGLMTILALALVAAIVLTASYILSRYLESLSEEDG